MFSLLSFPPTPGFETCIHSSPFAAAHTISILDSVVGKELNANDIDTLFRATGPCQKSTRTFTATEVKKVRQVPGEGLEYQRDAR